MTEERLRAGLADRYSIVRELGRGGMAIVYLAYDRKHDRRVALKVLRPELSVMLGVERFLTEIKTTANLQHPHILSLFDSGEVDGRVFYVMPYVEGESLRDRLTRERQLPVDDAVRIMQQVLDALGYAHEQGVIHRDVKPENILLHGNHPLVADFGIALAFSNSDAAGRLTGSGMSLGTPAYMSPEQATGERALTARSDIYSAACVLYEMLAGEPPFSGPSAQAILARVLTEVPRPIAPRRHTITPNIAAATERALQKLAADRFATAGDFAAALADPAYATPAHGITRRGVVRPGRWRVLRTAAPWSVAAAMAVLAAAFLIRAQRTPPPVARFVLGFDRPTQPTDELAISPDGSLLVYVGSDSSGGSVLYRRPLDQLDPVPLNGTTNLSIPFFAPDGSWLGFWQRSRLRRIAVEGGGVTSICNVAPGDPRGATWTASGTIVYSISGRLFAVPAAGGRPTPVPVADTVGAPRLLWPDALPGGREVLVAAMRGDTSRLFAVSLRDGHLTDLHLDGYAARWINQGYIAFVQTDSTIAAVPFDPGRLRVTGVPRPLALRAPFDPDGEPIWGVSRGGTLVGLIRSTPFTWVPEGRLVVLQRGGTGSVQVLPGLPAGRYNGPRLSPDGKRLAVSVFYASATTTGLPLSDIWVYDLGAKTGLRITFDSSDAEVAWTPDGKRVVFSEMFRDGLLRRATADGSGHVDSLAAGGFYDVQVTPDGRNLVFRRPGVAGRQDLWIASSERLTTARPLTRTPFDERYLALSPNGQWLAYASDETGTYEVYVRTLHEDSPHWRVSLRGGTEPRWAHSGRELFFRNGDTVYVAPITPGAVFHSGPLRAVIAGAFEPSSRIANFDVTPDDRAFVMFQALDPTPPPNRLEMVLNWFDSPGRRP
jgi:serine/threonine protein kinase